MIRFNQNPLFPDGTGDHLFVNDLYSTIQGEGVKTGTPVIMLRLHGCSVGCSFCDTKESWHVESEHRVETLRDALGLNPRFARVPLDELVCFIVREFPGIRWILLSGGEPAEQNILPLIRELHKAGFLIQMETSGTAIGHKPQGKHKNPGINRIDWLTVSPKYQMPGGKLLVESVLREANEIKQVVGKQDDIDFILKLMKRLRFDPQVRPEVCLQPVSQSKRATDLAIRECLRFGFRLSLQVHRLIEIR